MVFLAFMVFGAVRTRAFVVLRFLLFLLLHAFTVTVFMVSRILSLNCVPFKVQALSAFATGFSRILVREG